MMGSFRKRALVFRVFFEVIERKAKRWMREWFPASF